jgi:hypothetical protein
MVKRGEGDIKIWENYNIKMVPGRCYMENVLLRFDYKHQTFNFYLSILKLITIYF